MEEISLTDLQLDALKELGNISAGNAATAFSQMVRQKVTINVPQVMIIPISEISNIMKEYSIYVGLYQKIWGEIRGNILITLSRSSAFELVDIIKGKEKSISKSKVLTPLDQDILKELSNILAGSYLTALSRMTGFLFMPSVPTLTIDIAKAIIDFLFDTFPNLEYAIAIFNEMNIETTTIKANLFLFPDPQSLPVILKALEVI